MNKQTEKALSELIQLCDLCENHKLSEDSYTAPEFMDFLNRPLTIEDIPMESYNIEENAELAIDPKSIPWEDSIKNFVFDTSSINTNTKFSACIILAQIGYAYHIPTAYLVNEKYGKSNTIVIYIEPTDDTMRSFEIIVRRHNKVEYSQIIDNKYLVTSVLTWYVPKSTLVLCHDLSILEYKEALEMMPDITWSISCSRTNFVETRIVSKDCSYVCPIYSYPGSMETRAVGSGEIKFSGYKLTGIYSGRINYYSRCIRGSRHSSGRCYDCEMLYRLASSLRKSNSKEENKHIVAFDSSFLESIANKYDS